jgi:glycosyltransferase involved in cell wall biosynthesis
MPKGILRYADAERLVGVVRRYDPVLIHSSDMWLGNHLAWLKWRLRVPSILHIRAPLGFWGVHKHRLRAATGLISISTRITRTLRRAHIRAGRVAQIEDAVDIDRFGPREEAPRVLSMGMENRDTVHIGLVGRVEPKKRQLEFVEVASRVADKLPGRARFFIIGETRDTDYLHRLKGFADAHGLDGQLVLTGRRDDMPDVLRSLDVLVSLSGGSVMYEAMSCGLCVVSAGFTRPQDCMHLRDGVTGVVMATGKPAVLADRLADLVRHPEARSRLGAAAREWAKEKLSFQGMVTKTLDFYDRLLSHGTSRQACR